MNTKAIALTAVLGISTILSAWQPVEAVRRTGTTVAQDNTTEIASKYLAQRNDRGRYDRERDRGRDRDRYDRERGRGRDRDRYDRGRGRDRYDRDRDRDRYDRDRDRGRYRGR